MPFQHAGPTVSAQPFRPSHADLSHSGVTILSSKSSLPPAIQVQLEAPATRKQHHVSFKEDIEQTPSDVGLKARETSYPESEAGSTKPNSSRYGPSDLDSSKSTGGESAPSSKSRNRKRNRNRADKTLANVGGVHKLSDLASSQTMDRPSGSQPKSRDSSVSGKRSRQQSGPGILQDARSSNATKSEASGRSNPASSSGGGRRDRFPRTYDPRHAPGEAFAGKEGRQLFDPRRDDPVKFASQQRGPVDDRTRPLHGSSSPHLSARISTAASSTPQAYLSMPTSSAPRSPILQSLSMDSSSSVALELDDPKALQAHVVNFKKVYRSISQLEFQLQEIHRKQADLEREAMGDLPPPDLHDRAYWVKLVARHRDLAETYSNFLELTCRPELPRSIQELAEVYNIPSRLWQTGFHLMLESLRHNLSTHNSQKNGKARETELLDHLTEFIYYAYSFYSALHETERYSSFRRAWIESLGDLSRYRMAVAGLAMSLSLENGGEGIRNKQASRPVARIDDDDSDAADHSSYEDNMSDQVDKASIGSAALGDWEWVEKETWRQTAKDWYAKGIAHSPIIGRLHHHVGILSRDNELRALYHLTKSLITVKPFANARESILSLFQQQRQASRAWPDSSEEDLFIHLHGILLTRVQLDDFEPILSRFIAKLESRGPSRGITALPQPVLMMMACINISALLQYGSDDAVLVDVLLQDSGKTSQRSRKPERAKAAVPTALLVNPSATTDDNFLSELPRDAEWDDASDEESEAGDPQVLPLDHQKSETEALPELPSLAAHAARLCFAMLTVCLRSCEESRHADAYSTTLSTFLLSLCQSKQAFRLLERFVPWTLWLEHVERSVSSAERTWPKSLATSCISTKLCLPEDWCLRGIVGLSRQIYDRNVWRSASAATHTATLQTFENESEMLDCDDGELGRRYELSSVDESVSLGSTRDYRLAYVARKLAKAGRGFDFDTKTSKLSLSKFLVTRLTRWKLKEQQHHLEQQIDALNVNPSSVEDIADYIDDDTLLELDLDRNLKLNADATDSVAASDEIKALLQRRCYLKDVLHNLAARVRCAPHEKSFCRRADTKKEDVRPPVASTIWDVDQVVPGYTTLVVDTNVILTPGQMVQQLIESRRWTVVIPLAVITELDGLRRNDNVLGAEAASAIAFLEDSIKSQSKWLKVQTSRGNYLTDLSIRSEDIDFAWQDASTGNAAAPVSTQQQHSSMAVTDEGWKAGGGETKSAAARNVDEVILRILAWHKTHFVDRRNIVCPDNKSAVPLTGATNVDVAIMHVTSDTHKTVLLSLDRNLRLKAKTRGLPGLDEKGIARLMELTTSITAAAQNP